MERITEPEKSELRSLLMKQIDKFIENLPDDNHIGWIPANILELITDAAFAVIMTVHDTNIYIEEQGLMKD